MRVAYLTAGAAGMYCGSCMHDNTLARALIARGLECLLVPTYTPIRTDEQDISGDQIFFGGINIFLEQKFPLWGGLPSVLTHWLDRPNLLRWATRKTGSTSPLLLGALTVSMLQGMRGRQRTEVDRLCKWLHKHASPDVIVLSNFLIGGCVTELKRRLRVPIVVTLQGDDIFLDFLPSKERTASIELMRTLAGDVDAFIVNSKFYAAKMIEMFDIPESKMHVIPLGIDLKPFDVAAASNREDDLHLRPLRIGYLARIDPAKGLHHLVDAMIQLKQTNSSRHRTNNSDIELHVAGWLGDQNKQYAQQQWARMDQAGMSGQYSYHGSPDQTGKLRFLHQMDLFCVPTEYQEPKGLFALEAMAAGLPVILPQHGVFPEWVTDSNVAVLVPPGDPVALANMIQALANDASQRKRLSANGRQFVIERRSIDDMARMVHQLLLGLC